MKDIGTFKHGEEGTHWACDEVLLKNGECCGCTGHKCKLNLIRQSEPMKRIKKECKHDEHHATTKDGEHWCPVCREVLFSSPKPTKIKCGLKHKHGYWNCCACCIQGEVKGEGAWGHVKECEFYPKIEIDEFKFAEKRYMLDLGVSREEQALADKLNEVIRAVNKLLSH